MLTKDAFIEFFLFALFGKLFIQNKLIKVTSAPQRCMLLLRTALLIRRLVFICRRSKREIRSKRPPLQSVCCFKVLQVQCWWNDGRSRN